MSSEDLRAVRRNLQIVFQDPYASLNPKMPVNDIIGEALKIHGLWEKDGLDRVGELLQAGRVCRPSTATAIRTNSPAASGNASASPGRWRWNPRC